MDREIRIYYNEETKMYVIKPIRKRGYIYSDVERVEVPYNHPKARVIEQWLCDFGIIGLKAED